MRLGGSRTNTSFDVEISGYLTPKLCCKAINQMRTRSVRYLSGLVCSSARYTTGASRLTDHQCASRCTREAPSDVAMSAASRWKS